jgi:hypothetical protein
MFQSRSTEFDPGLAAIVDHLRAIESELGAIGRRAGRRVLRDGVARRSDIAEAIAPILDGIGDRVRQAGRLTANQAANVGSQAATFGGRVGNGVTQRVVGQTRQHPLAVLALALGIGVLIGAASRRSH